MKKNIIKNKSFDFAVRIVRLNQHLCNEKKEFVLSKQLLRSGTSVGAMVREAEYAETKADIVAKKIKSSITIVIDCLEPRLIDLSSQLRHEY